MSESTSRFGRCERTPVVVVRPGTAVVYDGTRTRASVSVQRRRDGDVTQLYRGATLSDAVETATDALSAGGAATIRHREYFAEYWSPRRLRAVERALRAAAYR